jgi:uncharacterized protein (DUF2141 family)
MNESIDWKSVVAFSVKDGQKSVLIRVPCVELFAVLVFANLSAMTSAQSTPCPGIHVNILNINNSEGTVACALFDSEVGFPIEFLRYATNIMVIKIRNSQARCDFLDIPPGTYSLLRFFKRCKSHARPALVFCSQLPLRRAKHGADDQLELLRARCTNAEDFYSRERKAVGRF